MATALCVGDSGSTVMVKGYLSMSGSTSMRTVGCSHTRTTRFSLLGPYSPVTPAVCTFQSTWAPSAKAEVSSVYSPSAPSVTTRSPVPGL